MDAAMSEATGKQRAEADEAFERSAKRIRDDDRAHAEETRDFLKREDVRALREDAFKAVGAILSIDELRTLV